MFRINIIEYGKHTFLERDSLSAAIRVAERQLRGDDAEYVEVVERVANKVVWSDYKTEVCDDCERRLPWWYCGPHGNGIVCNSCWSVREGGGPDDAAYRPPPLDPMLWANYISQGVIVGDA